MRLRRADRMEVRVEVAGRIFSDAMADMVALAGNVSDRLNVVLGLCVQAAPVERGRVERTAARRGA